MGGRAAGNGGDSQHPFCVEQDGIGRGQFPGNQVDAAYSGEEALSLLADTSYDLIIADYRMPGFSGLDLIKGVRYLDGYVPIILITGYGSDDVRAEAQKLGVNYYVEKPFDVEDLLGKAGLLLPDQGLAGG